MRARLLSLVSIAAVGLAALAAFYRVHTFDTFFHLAAGRWSREHGAIPHRDPFSFTFRGVPWHDHSWGYDAVLSYVHDAAGFAGITVLHAVLAGGLGFLAVLAAHRSARVFSVVVALSAIPFVAFREALEPRPHVIGFAAIAFTAFALVESERGVNRRAIFAIPPVYAVLVASHGSHVLVLVLVSLACVVAAIRREHGAAGKLAWISLACFAIAASLDPGGIGAIVQHGGSGFLEASIGEWAPVTTELLFGTVPGAVFVTFFVLGSMGVVVTIESARREGRRVEAPFAILCFVGFALVAFTARRMLPLFLFAAAPIYVPFVSRAISAVATESRALSPRVDAVLSVGVLVVGGLSLTSNDAFLFGAGLDSRRLPVAAVREMREVPTIRRTFHAYNYGGYLMYLGYPPEGVFVDGRAITVYPERFLARFRRAYDDPREFEALFAEHRCDSVLLPTDSERTGALIRYLAANDRFRLVHRDSVAVVFVTKSP